MRKILFSVMVAALWAPAIAQAPAAAGYKAEPLGATAIERQDWTAAERELSRAGYAEDDPARLINLGRIYAETGRRAEAITAWRRALTSDKEFMVQTARGEQISTRELARRALSLYEQGTRTVATLR